MNEIKPDSILDLRGVICPMNYVKTKLKLEEMLPGQILKVIIDGDDAVLNVPRSVKEEGHKIIKAEKTGDAFNLFIERA